MSTAALPPSSPLPSGPGGSPSSAGFYDAQVPLALHGLIERFGVGLLGEAGRLRGLLHDECPQAKREISVLLQALDERVPQDLLRVQSGEPIQSLSPRLTKRLVDEKSLSPMAARWAVDAWTQGLGLALPAGAAAATLDAASAANESHPADEWGEAATPSTGPATGRPPAAPRAFLAGLPPVARPAAIGLLVLLLALGLWFGFFQPKAEIAGWDTQGPLVADGKPHPVMVDIKTRNTSVQHIEVRFVRGDVTWPQPSWTVTPDGGPVTAGRTTAGSLAYQSDKPVNATFDYTLVGPDGRRSGPYEHSFTFLPPVVITAVRVPRPLPVGREFALSIHYKKGSSDIVQVERRIVNSSVPLGGAEVATQAVQLDAPNGTYDYRFDAAKQPMRSTVEFVLVDAQGVRSQPYKVAMDIGAASVPRTGAGGTAVVVAVREVQQAGQATGVGAVVGAVGGAIVGHLFGKGTGKDVSTVVGAGAGGVAGHQVEKNLRKTVAWDTTVRFDDGSTRVLRSSQAPTWKAGDRVQVADGAIVR